jgi:hypothetical protein
MEGVKFDGFFACVNRVVSATCKVVAKIGTLGQRFVQVLDFKGVVSSVLSRISSVFASAHANDDEGIEATYWEKKAFSQPAPKLPFDILKNMKNADEALDSMSPTKIHGFQQVLTEEESTTRDSIALYENADSHWEIGKEFVRRDEKGRTTTYIQL